MQVTETSAVGLKRELQVIVPRGELDQRYDARVGDFQKRANLPGFRKGKVPATHIKKMYGKSIMAEVVQEALEESSRKAVTDRNERPAGQPKIDLTEDKDEIEKLLGGQGDLAYKMSFEILPPIVLGDFSTITLERETAEVTEADLARSLDEIAKGSTTFLETEGRAAEAGDQVTIDYAGSIAGVPFEGGQAENAEIVIGRNQFIPGFEEGLKGAKAGEKRQLNVTFPEGYGKADLAGKAAVFDTVIKAVAVPQTPTIDDAFAKTLGVDDLAKLREVLTAQIKSQYDQLSRLKLKRRLLDMLDHMHTFELPEALVEGEFAGIWGEVEARLKNAGTTFEAEGKTEADARAEYRKIAERRVRLGLVLGEVGDKAKVQVTQDELRRALLEQTRRFPGQEEAVFQFYQKNPGALTELRAPIFEDKVVDHILGQVKLTEKIVSRDEMLKAAQEEMA
jgi:trigger factor